MRVSLVLLVAGVTLASVVSAAVDGGQPFLYGGKRDDAPAPEPRVVGTAGVAAAADVRAGWKATSHRVVANLEPPLPKRNKHLTPYHQPREWHFANLKDRKPELRWKRAEEEREEQRRAQIVRANVVHREPEAEEEVSRPLVRAHVRAADPHERHIHRPHHIRVHAHTVDVDPHTRHHHKPPRKYVLAHAVVPDAPEPERRRPEPVPANAHITRDEKRRDVRRHRETVVADAHITREYKPRRHHRRNGKVAPQLEVANAHITREHKRHRHGRAHKHAERHIVSADVSMRGRGYEPRASARKHHKREREIVSADVKVV